MLGLLRARRERPHENRAAKHDYKFAPSDTSRGDHRPKLFRAALGNAFAKLGCPITFTAELIAPT
jgi:hypothetical protein